MRSHMKSEPEDNIIFGVGTRFWYDEGATMLIAKGCPVGDYAERHASGDPGEAATAGEEILHHATMCQAENGAVTSAYLLTDGRHLCFTTIHEKQTTYIYVRDNVQSV